MDNTLGGTFLGAMTACSGGFPGGNPFTGEAVLHPVNHYTNDRYRCGHDLFYFPSHLREPISCAIKWASDENCPYRDLEAPKGIPGTIVILSYTPQGGIGPEKYGIVGFGRNTDEPLYASDSVSARNNQASERTYFVLHN